MTQKEIIQFVSILTLAQQQQLTLLPSHSHRGHRQPRHRTTRAQVSSHHDEQRVLLAAALCRSSYLSKSGGNEHQSSIFLFPTSPSDYCFPNIVFPLLSSPIDYHSRAERIWHIKSGLGNRKLDRASNISFSYHTEVRSLEAINCKCCCDHHLPGRLLSTTEVAV